MRILRPLNNSQLSWGLMNAQKDYERFAETLVTYGTEEHANYLANYLINEYGVEV